MTDGEEVLTLVLPPAPAPRALTPPGLSLLLCAMSGRGDAFPALAESLEQGIWESTPASHSFLLS